MMGTGAFHQHRPTRADEIKHLQEYQMFGGLKRSHEKEIAKEQHFQKTMKNKNYHIATAKPEYQSQLSKKTSLAEDERLRHNYKMKIPYTRQKHYEQKWGRKPMDVEMSLKENLKKNQSDFDRQ